VSVYAGNPLLILGERSMADDFEVSGRNTEALFTLKLHRGDGMALLAMNWKKGQPPSDFAGFAIEYKEPKGQKFFGVKNRLSFLAIDGQVNLSQLSTRFSPVQKFRWVHFPRNAELPGKFVYRVSPVFMNHQDELSYGDFQEVSIELQRETYPNVLNVAFTRGFVSSQVFVDRYESAGKISTLLPAKAADGLNFKPTHPKTEEALAWMGFEARSAIIEVLDRAIADEKAKVKVIAFDLNEPDIVTRLEKLGSRLQVIIDDSTDHKKPGSGENQAEQRLIVSAGAANVKRQHMSALQHNKTIIVDSSTIQTVVCGSTNFSWRSFFVQANNVMVLQGASSVKAFQSAFDSYWTQPQDFEESPAAEWSDLELPQIDARVAFSPHSPSNALLQTIGDDINDGTTSSLFFSLAFLYQTKGAIRDAIEKKLKDEEIFVYGISDKKTGGLDLQKPDGGNPAPVFPAALSKNVPEPFSTEPTGGGGTRMHHKFVVIDFDKPTARVYLGSYNFSPAADTKNGENLLLIKDRRIAVSYVVEAVRIIDHYHFRVAQQTATAAEKKLHLKKPPRNAGEKAWWDEDYQNPRKIRDRELFA
jgi:hypothetical protein